MKIYLIKYEKNVVPTPRQCKTSSILLLTSQSNEIMKYKHFFKNKFIDFYSVFYATFLQNFKILDYI